MKGSTDFFQGEGGGRIGDALHLDTSLYTQGEGVRGGRRG